jgi:hypothetical protein
LDMKRKYLFGWQELLRKIHSTPHLSNMSPTFYVSFVSYD